MTGNFIPGPWTIAPPMRTNRRVFMPDDTVEILTSKGGLVACLYRVNFVMDGKIDAANARLIAAAPDLYEACAKAEDLIRDGGVVPIKSETWIALVAALARARGEPSPDDSADGLVSVPKSHTWEA